MNPPETGHHPFGDQAVAAAFAGYSPALRRRLMTLRSLIYEAASGTEDIGPLRETLKWGQPSYLPACPGIGTTVRIAPLKNASDDYALFVHCQTRLIDTFRQLYGDQLHFLANRAVRFSLDDPLPEEALKHCVALALTYHRRKRRAA